MKYTLERPDWSPFFFFPYYDPKFVQLAAETRLNRYWYFNKGRSDRWLMSQCGLEGDGKYFSSLFIHVFLPVILTHDGVYGVLLLLDYLISFSFIYVT